MKNIVKFLFVLIALVGSSELTKAQSTFGQPWPGSTHTYSFDAVNGAHTTTWWISKTDDGGSPLAAGEYSFVDHGGYTVAADFNKAGFTNQLTGTGISAVKIQWNGTATGKYYLFLSVDDGTCTNLKGYMIDVQAGQFNAILADVTGAADKGTSAHLTAETCPDDTDRHVIVNEGTYSLGTSELTFRVNRQYTNTGNGWQVGFVAPRAGATITKVVDAAGTTITPTGGNYVVSGTQDYILVTVTVTNVLDTPDVTLAIDPANTKDTVTDALDTTNGDDSKTHGFKAKPTIGTISGS